MVFGDKLETAYNNSFSSKKLVQYVEKLIKEVLVCEKRSRRDSRYTWLKSSHLDFTSVNQIMEELKPLIFKLTPESCASVACKLDNMTNETVTIATTVCYLKSLLEEQCQMQLIQENIGRTIGTARRRKMNRVHPELLPPGRQPVVSFILLETCDV